MRVFQRTSEVSNGTGVLVPNAGFAMVIEDNGNQRGVRGAYPQTNRSILNSAFIYTNVGATQVNVGVHGILYCTPHYAWLGGIGAINVGIGFLHLAEAHGREGVVVGAIAEIKAVPATHLAVQGSEDNAIGGCAHGIEHTALAAARANIERSVFSTFHSHTRGNSEFGGAAIDFHIAQQGITVFKEIPSLVVGNASSRHGNVGAVGHKSQGISIQSEGAVGSAGINAEGIARGGHTRQRGVKIVGSVKDTVQVSTHHAGIASRGSVFEVEAAQAVVRHKATRDGRMRLVQPDTPPNGIVKSAIVDGGLVGVVEAQVGVVVTVARLFDGGVAHY